ncbi:OsmC family protein [Candidatus Micrarchaeota archaeon]|nr:OsmC family protein [Candidatus Micrarchaeota archaeon]
MNVNNVELDKVMAFVQEVEQDHNQAVKVKKIKGSWNLEDGKPQFSAVLGHAQGNTSLESDAPPFLGGSGQKPDPVQYCLFGLSACFAQTFASVAAEKGVKLTELSVSAENKVNLSKSLGLSDEPIVESVKITVTASASGDDSKLKEIEQIARERCPGVYCLTKPIQLETELIES